MNALPLAPEPGSRCCAGRALAVRRLELRDFRNYRHVALEPRPGPIVLHGENGAGKTNLLEAVSLLSPGRGLRRRQARRDRPQRRRRLSPARRCSTGITGPVEIETGHDRDAERRSAAGSTASRCAARTRWASICSLLWLTPAMDRLFAEGAAGRRRFLDRLVLAIDSGPCRARRRLRARVARALAPACVPAGAMPPGWARSSSASPRPASRSPRPAASWCADLDGELARAQHSFPPPAPRPRRRARELARRRCRRSEAEQRLAETLAASTRRGRRRPAAPRSGRTAATSWPPTRWRGEAAARCSTGRQKAYPDQHRAGPGAAAAAAARRPADPAAGRGHRPSRPAPPHRAAGAPWSTSARSAGSPAPRPDCSTPSCAAATSSMSSTER